MNLLSGLATSYIESWKRSFDFKGITKRIDYWHYFAVDSLVLFLLICLVENVVLPFALISMIPRYAMANRRLRDAGYSGFWIFIILLPALGPIILISRLIQPTKNT